MREMKKKSYSAKLVMTVMLIVLLGVPKGALAVEETAGDYFYGMSAKFGRGLWNVVSSPAEIPCGMITGVRNEGGSGYFTGFGKGVLFFLRRVLVGVTEVGTFVIPMDATISPVCTA